MLAQCQNFHCFGTLAQHKGFVPPPHTAGAPRAHSFAVQRPQLRLFAFVYNIVAWILFSLTCIHFTSRGPDEGVILR